MFRALQEPGDAVNWQEILFELSNETKAEQPYDESAWEPVIREILSTEPKVVPMYRRSKRWISYAAAVIILAVAGWAVWQSTNHKQPSIPVAVTPSKVDILPGGNKAVLKLANGQLIILDSAVNGQLAVQGNTSVVKLDNGKIAYESGASGTNEVLYNTVSTPKGGQYTLVLGDGTQVWLNAASSITYPASFSGDTRDVQITGEAYFEVAKDQRHPFHVNFGGTTVEVLGTHFNVNAYADDGVSRTTLLEGSVKVVSGTQQLLIRPAEQAVKAGDNLTANKNVNIEQVMAWKNGLFNFDGANLQMVLRQLERWYDVEIVYDGNVPQRKFGGEISRNLNLSEVLKVLEKVEVKFKIEGRKLIVSGS